MPHDDAFDTEPHRRAVTPDEALSRLEDTLQGYPFDRALPNLGQILQDAGIGVTDLRADDRALKVLHEAILARPLASVDTVGQTRTDVELLTLEVEVLTERLRDPDASPAAVKRAEERLREVRRWLADLRRVL